MEANFFDDIPLDFARQAHAGTSFDLDERAGQELASYAGELAGDFEALSKYAITDEKKATLEAEFVRYRVGYRRRYLVMLGAKSRCLSTMISGPSNFNTRRYQKRGDSADKRTQDLIDFRVRALAAIRKVLTPELAPIALGDSDAAERLAAKLAKLEAFQVGMKAANAAIRKHAKAGPEAQVAALVALNNGISEDGARKLLKPDFCGRIGFPSYEITNNGAEIRRLKGRQVAVERAQSTLETKVEANGITLEDAPSENRVRLFFPGKPSVEVRTKLKSRGFRWAPTLGCWSAYRNNGSLETAQEFVKGGSDVVQVL